MQFSKVPTDTFSTLQINAGIMTDDFNPSTGVIGNILGATTGGLTFNANPEYEDFGEDVDNVPANTKQLKRAKSYDPAASGNFVTVSAALAGQLSGPGELDGNKFTPAHGFVTDYVDDIWIIGDYSDKNTGAANAGYVAVHIKNAMNTAGFQWTTTKDGKGQFAFDYHGHYDINSPDDVPFEIYVKAGSNGTLTALTVASTAGTEVGDSNIAVSGYTLGSGESWKYKTATSTAPTVTFGESVSTWTTFTSGSDITPTEGHTKIAVVAADSNNKAIAYGSATLTVKTT